MKQLLGKGSIVILLGAGGVGKTTVAAALGLAAASERLDTALITVDPARRLRDALGVHRLGGHPARLPERALRAAGLDPALKLSAMQLDVKGAWDAMVERCARNPATRRRILENSFYQRLTSEYAGSEAYAALQQLYDLHQSESFEVEIVDTPPAAHAFEFLKAPARLARLLDSRTARWLFTPSLAAGSAALRLASAAARFVVRELERFAGANVLATVSDFFAAASEAVDAIVDLMHKTEALLHSPAVRFVLVTTAEEDRLRGAHELAAEMQRQGLSLSAVVVNRFLDESACAAVLDAPAAALGKTAATRAAYLDAIGGLRPALRAEIERGPGLRAVIEYLEDYRTRAVAELRSLERFARELSPRIRLAIAPEMEVGAHDLAALHQIARFLMTPVRDFRPPSRVTRAARYTGHRLKARIHRGGH